MVNRYYEIGQLIVEHQQKGQEKAKYGNFETLARKFNLSWSHYVFLMRLPDYDWHLDKL